MVTYPRSQIILGLLIIVVRPTKLCRTLHHYMIMDEAYQKNRLPDGNKLWIDVPPPSAASSTVNEGSSGALNNKPPAVVKHTVTTLLRHHSTLVRQEKEEKLKVQSYTDGSLTSNQDHITWRSKDLEEMKQRQMEEAKRILKARLAYHKAIAATEHKASEKSAQAQQKRDETRRLAAVAEKEKIATLERRRATAAEIQDIHNHSRDMVIHVQNQKRREAAELRMQTQHLKDDAKRREFVEFLSRKERIQQIQASRQALRAANTRGTSTPGFIGALGSPDTEIRLKLTKEAEEAALEEKRKRVQEIKHEREHKLENVKARLEKQMNRMEKVRALQTTIKTMPPFVHPSQDLADEEIVALMDELHTYKSHARGNGNNKTGELKGARQLIDPSDEY